jgi:hypothetical protein
MSSYEASSASFCDEMRDRNKGEGPDKGAEVFSGHEDSLAGFVAFVGSWQHAS